MSAPEYEQLDLKERTMGFLAGFIVGALVLWLFYAHGFVLVFALPAGFLGIKILEKMKADHERERLKSGFSDFLSAFAAALEAGEAPENAVLSAYREVLGMHGGSFLCRRLAELIRKIRMNEALESAFLDFAETTKDEDVKRFADVFALTKRRGGDLLSVIRPANRNIREKAEVKRQIKTITTAKRLEAAIMAVMPPGMILYFLLTDRAFLAPLYTGAGRLVMTVLLALYAGCIALMLKITDIEV